MVVTNVAFVTFVTIRRSERATVAALWIAFAAGCILLGWALAEVSKWVAK